MRFKTTFLKNGKHSGIVPCVGWNNFEEVYSCGDDHALIKWNSLSNESAKICDLPDTLFATDMHWFPKMQGSGRKQGFDLLLITSADGKFHLMNKNGRLEKSVDAHQGAALVGQWSYDGAGLLTAGEDGQVKIWSRSGMLRSTIVQGDTPIYTATWGADSNQVLLAQGKTLMIKPLAPNTKPNRWRAHDGLILKVAWNENNSLIVSGGEDCRYKVWDAFGRQLYSSIAGEHPITSLAWAPGGDLFAVGAFNTLRLCDKVGWSYSLDKPNTGSIYGIAWSIDGTQIAGACGNGNVIFAHIVDRRIEWKNLEVTLVSRRSITVFDILNDITEKLEFPERVAKMELEHNHLVVLTSLQCHIFSTTNWNTPIILELKEGSANMVLMSYRHFLLVERWGINIYSYDGKLLCSPKIPGMQLDTLDASKISLSADTLAILDQNDEKVIHLLDLTTGRQPTALSQAAHTLPVIKLALSQVGTTQERELAFLDRNRDIYLCAVRGERRVAKLGVMVQSLAWNVETNVLAGLQDSVLTIWFHPTALFVDKYLLRKTTMVKDLSDYGKSPSLMSFIGNLVHMRRLDGSLTSCTLPAHFTVLHSFVAATKWEDALRLCRFVNDDLLWACLASMSVHAKELTTAEEAYAAINELDKVAYIHYIKSLPLRSAQAAHMALLAGNHREAENILLLNGLIFRAIMTRLDTHDWNRALELAVKHRTHVDTVLYKRKCYLESFDKTETNEKYLQYQNEVELDPQKIKEKIAMEYAKEKEKHS